MITVKEAALRLGVTAHRVRQLIKARRLLAYKHGRDWVIEPSDLAAVHVRKYSRRKVSTDGHGRGRNVAGSLRGCADGE